MKNTIWIGLLSMTISIYSQTEPEILKRANDLIAVKKYLTAFKTLDNYDLKNDTPEIVLLKEKIVLDYFVSSIMHRMFALKDLKPNEDIMQYRGQQGKFDMFMFPVDSLLERLIKKYPDNCRLIKGLADYYYEVDIKYPDGWFKSKEEVFNLMEMNYKTVIADNCADYLSYYALGYISISRQKYDEGIPYLLKSIELNKKYASSYYNLAYAYLYSAERSNALTNAKLAFDLYNDQAYKADAANMIAVIYSELKDDKNSILYYEKSNEISPNNYNVLKPLLSLYVKTDDPRAFNTRELFFNLAPDNPTIHDDLFVVYSENKKTDELIDFYKIQISKYPAKYKIIGSLYFYLGRLYHEKQQDKEAKVSFLKAKENLSKVFSPNSKVFEEIDRELKELKQ